MPHDIRPRDTKGTRSVLVDHELSGVIVGQTLATAPEAYRALLEATAFGTRIISTCGSPRAANIGACISGVEEWLRQAQLPPNETAGRIRPDRSPGQVGR